LGLMLIAFWFFVLRQDGDDHGGESTSESRRQSHGPRVGGAELGQVVRTRLLTSGHCPKAKPIRVAFPERWRVPEGRCDRTCAAGPEAG
jgi:hypothetical protein